MAFEVLCSWLFGVFPDIGFLQLVAARGCFWLFLPQFLRVVTAGGERSSRAKRASEALCCFLLLLLSGCFPKLSFEWFLGVPQFALILSCAETSLKISALPVPC